MQLLVQSLELRTAMGNLKVSAPPTESMVQEKPHNMFTRVGGARPGFEHVHCSRLPWARARNATLLPANRVRGASPRVKCSRTAVITCARFPTQ